MATPPFAHAAKMDRISLMDNRLFCIVDRGLLVYGAALLLGFTSFAKSGNEVKIEKPIYGGLNPS